MTDPELVYRDHTELLFNLRDIEMHTRRPLLRPVNPDGPRAADLIERLTAALRERDAELERIKSDRDTAAGGEG